MSRGIHFDRFTTQIEVPSTDSWKKGRKFHVTDAPFTVFDAYENHIQRITVNVETAKSYYLVTKSTINGNWNVERYSKETHKECVAEATEMIRERARNGLAKMHSKLEQVTRGIEHYLQLLDAPIEVSMERQNKTDYIMENYPMSAELEEIVSE